MSQHGVDFAGIVESHTYRDHLSDKQWRWDPGVERRPSKKEDHPSGGIGMFVDRGLMHSIVRAGTYVAWNRVEVQQNDPIFVAVCYFPHSTDTKKHKKAWKELEEGLDDFRHLGHVAIMGDFNAHTGLDASKVDTAGRLLLAHAERLDIHILNGTPTCRGTTTRTVEHTDGTCTKTAIDYVMVSQSLLPHVSEMTILNDRMGSDHHPIVLKLSNLCFTPAPGSSLRKVWRVEKIPHFKDKVKHDLFVGSFAAAFDNWVEETKSQLEALQVTDADNTSIADVVEHSFQTCLDEVCDRQLGTKRVGPSAVPQLTHVMEILNKQRKACELILRKIVSNPKSTSEERAMAVKTYRVAKAKSLRAGAVRKELLDLKRFTDMEKNQRDSKIFWAKAKQVMIGLRSPVSPPPMVESTVDGVTTCETDPIKVLKLWRESWKSVVNPSQEEEAIYDNEHRDEILSRLELLRKFSIHQPNFDRPIDREEVWTAIRKIKCGKAPGVDGVLSTIIKEAADAVGTTKLKDYNPVVDSLTLVFNFVFKHEVWPKRWGQGIIFPIFKEGSRLDPGNYRPITLLSQISKLFGSVVENRLSNWSEETMALADEQGGFRRCRGAPELIFMLREIILNRKALGRPTLTTFIDARKAYDSVWREGNYVRLHDLGVRGKLWRQLQAMNANSESKIRLPYGETESFKITRGVAQGAVESPFLYSCFINGLAEDLRQRGLGIQAGGVLTPLLMYADDIVLLASSVEELREMNKMATDYAFKNRYQFNGKKSAVMAFNASRELYERAQAEPWTLLGQPVEVKKSYKYLGTEILHDPRDWSAYMERVLGKAKRASKDLAWKCGQEAGLLPRTAAALWKSIVRPVLEYAAELWAGDIPTKLIDRAEKIQTNYAKSILGLVGCQSVPHDFLRAELGMEKLTSRWEKLRLGYWRRLHMANFNTTLRSMVSLRKWQVDWAPSTFDNGWMGKTKAMLEKADLSEDWRDPSLCCKLLKEEWKDKVYDSVEERETRNTITRLVKMTSNHASRYVRSKRWDKVEEEFARSSGEIGRRGALVPEPYLDDRKEPVGRRLKLMCRAGCLPVMKRVVREAGLPPWQGTCRMCSSGEVEDIEHMVMHCAAHARHRNKLLERVSFDPAVSQSDRLDVLLGKSTGVAKTDAEIDAAVKRFLKKAWRGRKWLVLQTNKILDRKDTLWAVHSHGDGLNSSYIKQCEENDELAHSRRAKAG